MPLPITAFLPYGGHTWTGLAVEQIRQSGLVERIVLLSPDPDHAPPAGCDILRVDSLHASATIRRITATARTPFVLLLMHDCSILLKQSVCLFPSVPSNIGI